MLAARSDKKLPSPDDEHQEEEDRELFGFEQNASAPFDILDPDPDFELPTVNGVPVAPEPGALVETALGIEVYRLPEQLLLEDESLWPIVQEWRAPRPRELSARECAERSAFFVAGWRAMLSTHYRALEREYGPKDEAEE